MHSEWFELVYIVDVTVIRHLFNHTNGVDTLYLLYIYTMLLLHVSVYLTPSSGRTYLFLTQKTPAFAQLLSAVQWL